MIEHVECIRAELERHILRCVQHKVLGEASVEIEECWATQNISIADLETDRSGKGAYRGERVGVQIDRATLFLVDAVPQGPLSPLKMAGASLAYPATNALLTVL